jgi:hypothetical protein
VEASEGESFEQGEEADCAKFNVKGKSGSKFTCPPTQKKGRNQGWSSGRRETSQKQNLTADYQKNQNKKPYSDLKTSFNTEMCPVFGTKHPLWRCSKFQSLTTKQRQAVMSKFKLCYHCLGSGHRISSCRSSPGLLCGIKGCKRFE